MDNVHNLASEAPHKWADRSTTLTREVLFRKPETRETLCGLFPVKATSALISMGGVGKTTLTVYKSIGYLSDNFHVLFVSAEDSEEDYQAKAHNLLFNESGPRAELENAVGRIHILNLKGAGVKLVAEAGGNFVPSLDASTIVSYIEEVCPKVRLVVFETLSRFAGGEDNERMEAIVSACDHIAIAINGACVLVHHMGKSQSREKVIDLYSGRGGSTLGDNTRSLVVLTRLDDDYMGALPIVVNREDLEHGRVFEMFHVRNSYGPTQSPEYYISRKGYCNGPTLEPVPIATDADVTKSKLQAIQARNNKAATELHNIIRQEGGWVKRKYFDANTQSLLGLTQKDGRELIAEMIDAGSLEVKEKKSGSGQMMSGLVIRNQNKGASA